MILFEDETKRIFFKNYNLNSANIDIVKILINDLYTLNGPDESGQGTFNSKDIERFFSTDFDLLFGRKWQSGKYKYCLALRINRQDNEITLIID